MNERREVVALDGPFAGRTFTVEKGNDGKDRIDTNFSEFLTIQLYALHADGLRWHGKEEER